jgi:membrane protein implicated in regulation of membrane protease activity
MRSAKAILFGTDRRAGEGFSAGLWATWAFGTAFAAIGGMAKGIWWAAAFLIPAAVMLVVAVRRARERNL